MAWHRLCATAVGVLTLSGPWSSAAYGQAQFNRGPNPNSPKLMISTLRSDDKKLGLEAAEMLRERIADDVGPRSLVVLDRKIINSNLVQSGYDTTVALYNVDSTKKVDPSLFKIDFTNYPTTPPG